MAEPVTRQPAGGADEKSLGSLVSAATADLSKLVRYELDLAKLELRNDVKRVGIGGAMFGVAAYAGALILVMLCIALAYGLVALHIFTWAAFLIVAGALALLAGLAALIGLARVRKVSGLRQTRQTVQADLTMLRRDNTAPAAAQAAGRPA